jgi:hypothetical protein
LVARRALSIVPIRVHGAPAGLDFNRVIVISIRKNILTRSGIPGLERKSSHLDPRRGQAPKSVIPFIMEVHHASLLSRMAAHFDGAI